MVERNALTGGHWPPKPSANFHGTFDPWGLPLVNTLILLLSGTTVTWAHHALLENNRKGLVWGLVLTVILGVLFTACQAYEYVHAGFKFAGHIYGSTFFMATGFHGAHVIIGTLFLARLPVPRHGGPLHAQAALRLRGGGLVLALRRRGLAVPVHLHLRDRCRHAAGALTNRHAGAGVPASAPAVLPGQQYNSLAGLRLPGGYLRRPNCRAVGDRRAERNPRHAWPATVHPIDQPFSPA